MNSAENGDGMPAGDGDARDVLDAVGERMKLITSKVHSKLYFHKDAAMEYLEMKDVISDLAEEKSKLERERRHGGVAVDLARLQVLAAAATGEMGAARQDLADAREALAQKNRQLGEKEEELATATEELAAARQQLALRNHELDEKNEKLKALRLKLQEMETRNYHAADLDPSQVQTTRAQTRSMQKRKILSEVPSDYVGSADENEHTSHLKGPSLSPLNLSENFCALSGSMEKQKGLSERTLGSGANNLEVTEERPRQELVNNPPAVSKEDDIQAVRDEMIKGFLEIDTGRRIIGIKKMGQLDEKAFKAACLAKVPPEEVGKTSFHLYSSWKQQLGDLSWYPFKAITIDGNHQEIVNIDDVKLQELKNAWGSGAYNAVVNALVEMKEYGCLNDRSIVYELWNFKEGRRATTRECVDYMSNQVKMLTVTKRRKTCRWSSMA